MKKKNLSILILCVFTLFGLAVVISAATCTHSSKAWEPVPGDQDYHYLKCKNEDCGVTLETGLHTCSNWSTTAATHSGECSVCKYTIQNIGHSFEWETNATEHWQKCKVCKYETNEELHDFEYMKSETQHWQRCSDCGYTTEKGSHESELTITDESHGYTCTACGFIESQNHTLNWYSSISYHWQKCIYCSYTTPQELHTLDDNKECTVCSRSNIIMKIVSPKDVIPVAK